MTGMIIHWNNLFIWKNLHHCKRSS